MNDTPSWDFAGHQHQQPLLARKKLIRATPSRAAENESFEDVPIRRETLRHANHRRKDRHRLDNETAEIRLGETIQKVNLVNLSGGGAMIEGADELRLWDRVELTLAEGSRIEAIVRWVRNHRYGLEFAQETRIEGGDEETARLLREVILRSFPHINFHDREAAGDLGLGEDDDTAMSPQPSSGPIEREARLPMIWTGVAHYNHESFPVRLRNISSGGTLIECGHTIAVGGELLLELERAGSFFATVNWAHGDCAGLRFQEPFDLQALASSRPTLAASRWEPPRHVRANRRGDDPWAMQRRG